MTTATATRRKKKTTTKGKKKTKKPKWVLVTFKQIEKWRVKIGLSKSGMAEALGVTNSTFHNWQRGTTVPHPNQQTEILTRLNALESNASGSPTSSGGTGKSVGKGAGRKANGRSGASGRGGKGGSSNRASRLGTSIPGSQASPSDVPRDVNPITVAWIMGQAKPPTPAAVYKFIEGLREVL